MRAACYIAFVVAATLCMAGCASSQNAVPGPTLEDRVWRLIELNGQPFVGTPDLRVPTIQISAESQRVNGVSGINRYSGGYESSGSNIKIGTVAGTRMAGPAESMKVESAFLEALGRITSWEIKGNQLELNCGAHTLLRFQVDMSASP